MNKENLKINLEAARHEAQKQWNANPCGSLPTDKFDKPYFDAVEGDRYRQQYWQRDYFQYGSFNGKKVLEIGIGLGTDLRQFAEGGAECFGIDITDRHIELTLQNFAVNGLKVDVRKADANCLPFPDNTFDVVHSFGVLHHIPDVESALQEISRVLKPDGKFLVSVYHKWSVASLVLFVKSVLTGRLFTIGVDGVLATIEKGADGIYVKPYVKLYTKSEWKQTVEQCGFKSKRLDVRQVNFERHKILNLLRPMQALFGWYICGVFSR